jgi:outer membrane protein
MKFKLTILALLIGFLSFSQTKKWSLIECVKHALENNITVKQGENTLLLNEQDIKAAKGNFLPSLGASLSQNVSFGQAELFPGEFVNRTSYSTGLSLGLSQTVFNGFRNTYFAKQAKLTKETNEYALNRIRDDISLNVANAYLNILFNKERLEVAKAQYEFSEKQLAQIQQLVDSGVQPRADIYDAEATLSNDAQAVTVAQNNFTLALLSMSQILQIPFEGFDVEVIEIDTPSAELMYADIKPILNYALNNRNEIKVAEKGIENSQLGVEISKSGYYPSVSASYGFGTNAFYTNLVDTEASFFNQLNDNRGHSLGLSLSIPIFSRFQNKTSVAKSKIQVENSKLQLEQAKLDLESIIQRAFTDAQAALKTYVASQKSLESQQLAFNNAKDRYDLGNMNSFDLEQVRIRLINAQSSLINAKYDFVFKTKILDFYLGKQITF